MWHWTVHLRISICKNIYVTTAVLINKESTKIVMFKLSSWLVKKLNNISNLLADLRYFSFYNESTIEFIFLFLYAAEQLLLLRIISAASSVEAVSNIAGYFAIIILFTAGLQKIFIESKISILKNELIDLTSKHDKDKQKFKDKVKQMDENMKHVLNRLMLSR